MGSGEGGKAYRLDAEMIEDGEARVLPDGPLRVGRPLRGVCTFYGCDEVFWSSRWSEAMIAIRFASL